MKKFGFYFKKGFVLTKMAMKGKSVFTKVLLGLYLILSFFGKFLFFTRPIFLIADNNLAMMVTEGHDLEIDKIFEGINSKKRYSSLLLSSIFIDGISIAASVLLVLPFYVWLATGLYNPAVNPWIFFIIFSVAAMVFSLVLQLVYAPMGFVTCKGKELNAGDILFLSKEGTVSIKGKIIGICLINYLLIGVILGVLTYLPFFFGLNFYDELGNVALFVNFVNLFIILVLIVVDVFVLTIFRMSMKISLYSLFYDNVETKHVILAKQGNGSDVFIPLFADDKEVKNND